MRKAIKQIAVCAVLLLLFCLVCRFAFYRSYTAFIPLQPGTEENFREPGLFPEIEEPEVLRVGEPRIRDGYMQVAIQPEQRGETDLIFRGKNGEETPLHVLRVSRFHTVYDMNTGDFTGANAVLIAVTMFWLLVSAIMLWHFRQAKGPAFYAYASVYYAGFFLFALTTGLTMLRVTANHLVRPAEYSMMAAYGTINSASISFMQMTTPLMLAFAIAMAVSNIVLLRHMRPRVQNVLGLLISGLLIGGEVLGWVLFSRDFSGSEWEGRIRNTLENTYATVFVYFECMLMGSVICGIRAVRYEPVKDKDFIIILGCWFRRDGSLPPLLRGRVDRALAFWREQKKVTGKEAVFIPSGGQGWDELMPEAEAIRRYLLSQGVPDRLILPEKQSGNTLENMLFSKEVIRDINPEGKTIFATTNYHVFRSGVWAGLANLPAEGIGSRTKWWFWPNAFMRETVGLLQKRWWQETLFLILLIGFFSLLSMTVG